MRVLRRRYGRAARPLSVAERRHALRWYGRKYGLTDDEAVRLAGSRRSTAIEGRLEVWRERNGLPPHNSGLTRGELLDIMREEGV